MNEGLLLSSQFQLPERGADLGKANDNALPHHIGLRKIRLLRNLFNLTVNLVSQGYRNVWQLGFAHRSYRIYAFRIPYTLQPVKGELYFLYGALRCGAWARNCTTFRFRWMTIS